jgi:Ca-activated chloride channel family protein
MISFSNYGYIVYIFIAGSAVIAFHIFYSIWRRMAVRSAVGSSEAARRIVEGFYSRILFKEILIFLAVMISCLILLGPGWGDKARETSNEGTDVLVALDVSRSMLAKDADPSRLEKAKSAVRLIAESLEGDRIGLIIFAGDAFLQCPLTNDIGAFMMFLDSVNPDSVRVQGTDMGRMLAEAGKVYQKKRLTSRMLIVVTDGEDHEGGVDAEAEKFKELGVSVYAAGIGRSGDLIPAEGSGGESGFYRDSEGNLIKTGKNEDLLKQLADKTGGFYIDITDNFSGLGKILNLIESKENTYYGSRMVKEKIDRTYVFLIILIVLLAVEMFIPERKVKNP